MSMISIINEAINRKLASTSFTTIIKGVVIDLNPLKIKINDRITIGLDFIEPKSLGINDDSPSPALPLIVGESVDMIRYNNGQRFYVLGKSVTSGNYNDLEGKPKINNVTLEGNKTSSELGITGDKHFTYIKSTPDSVWEITHDLDKYPSVTVVDSAGSVVIGDITYTSKSALKVTFSAAFSGKAYLN